MVLKKGLLGLYTLLFWFALPIIFLRLFVRSLGFRGYRERCLERVGYYTALDLQSNKNTNLWVHAVSVGETIAAIPLMVELLKAYPKDNLIFTCTTPTGSLCFQKACASELKTLQSRIEHVYLPYDIPSFLGRFFQRYKPKTLVLMETELWPNTLDMCAKTKIPVFIANARLSSRSFTRYYKIRKLLKPFFEPIVGVLAQSAEDANRFESIGFDNKVVTTGNIKFDGAEPNIDAVMVQKVKERFNGYLIWVCASTHEGEEKIILEVFSQLVQQNLFKLKLVLVPRHPDRFDKVQKLIFDKNLSSQRRSLGYPEVTTQVWLGDSMGEMWSYLAMADMVFVGGSLVNIGGHNLLEPSALHKPILTGPYLHNFTAIEHLLLEHNALTIVDDANDLKAKLIHMMDDAHLRTQMGGNAFNALNKNKGALQKHLAFIKTRLILES